MRTRVEGAHVISERFATFLSGRSGLARPIAGEPSRGGEHGLRRLWEATEMSASDVADEVGLIVSVMTALLSVTQVVG